MAQVAVTLNGRDYVVTCDDGEQEHVTRLARSVDDKVRALAKGLGQIGEARLLAMASILLADEIDDLKSAAAAPSPPPPVTSEADEALDRLAGRLEMIAARLEST
jgi:cell division protein ZapA